MSDTISGTKESTMVYSMAATARANNLNLYENFNYLLEKIPEHMDNKNTDFVEKLLPWALELPEQIRK